MTTFPYKGHGVRDGVIGTGQVKITAFAVPTGSIDFWTSRLEDHRVEVEQLDKFGDPTLRFRDPSGLYLELVGTDEDDREPWITDEISVDYREQILQSISNLEHVGEIAENFDLYFKQACDRTFPTIHVMVGKNSRKKAGWYDNQCRALRSRAVATGQRVTLAADRDVHAAACREYRACKQRKQRQHYAKCMQDIIGNFKNNKCNMWKIIDKYNKNAHGVSTPGNNEIYEHFKRLSNPLQKPYFDYSYESEAKDFINTFSDKDSVGDLEHQVLNSNFTALEVISAIKNLKKLGQRFG